MPFETLKPEDIGDAKTIWARSFGDEPGFIDHYFAGRIPPGHVFGLRDGEGLASILCIVPMQYKVRDALVRTAFVSGVSTLPEKRGKGHIAQLMSGVIPHLKEMGFVMAFLSPAVKGMYEKYGFSYCTQKNVLSTDKANLSRITPDPRYQVQPFVPDDISCLATIYDRLCEQSSCIPARTESDWRFLLHDLQEDGGGILIAIGNGIPAGYMTYRCEEDTLESPESVFTEPPVFYRLANEALQRSGLEKGTFVFQPAVSDVAGSKIEPDGMGRVIDMEALATLLADGKAGAGEAAVEILDPLCPWNEGIFRFGREENGRYHFTQNDNTPEIKMAIGEWTRWICGSVRLDAVQPADKDGGEGQITDAVKRLAKILPKKNCICFDKY